MNDRELGEAIAYFFFGIFLAGLGTILTVGALLSLGALGFVGVLFVGVGLGIGFSGVWSMSNGYNMVTHGN